MYDNIGGKIKILAKISFAVTAIAGVIAAISFMQADEDALPFGLLVLIASPIVAWVSSWMIYGFGELIDKVSAIERNTRGDGRKTEEQAPAASAAVFCTTCGAKVDGDSAFCTTCGTRINSNSVFCTTCGAKMDGDSAFCTVCGSKLK